MKRRSCDELRQHWHTLRQRSSVGKMTVPLGMIAVFACGGEVTEPPPNPQPTAVASVVVTPSNDTLFSANATLQATATARDANGNPISGKTFTWTSSNNTVATVNSSGLVTAAGPNGAATITAATDGVSGTATIVVATGPQGGTVLAASGRVTLEVPAGAVSQVISITVTPASQYPYADRVVAGSAFDFGPEGTVFTSPVTLTIEYDPNQIPSGADESRLRLHRVSGKTWTVVMGGSVSVAENKVAATVDGFSTFGVLEAQATAACIAQLEAALDDAVNGFVRVEPLDLDNLDGFTFVPARECFREAYNAANTPELAGERQTAAFGLAATTLLSLEDDADLRAAVDDWDAWLDGPGNDDIGAITRGTGDMPPTLEQHQILVRSVVEPALAEALGLLDEIDDPEFVFFLTPGMQGEDQTGTPTLELDQSEVLALRAALETGMAAIDVFLAYQTVPSPYGPAGFSSAMEEGSTFLSLNPAETARLTDARERLLRAVDLAGEAFDFMVAETDDQTDDVVRYEPAGPSFDCDLDYTGRALPCRMNRLDVQDVRDVLADVGGMLAGPYTVVRGIGIGSDDDFLLQDVVVDASKFFLDPISDLKALLPAYEVSEGDFHWVALAFDEWTFPDPGLNGILPDITTSAELRGIVGGDDLWQEAAYQIDAWGSIAVNPNNGSISAMTKLGNLYWISSDFSSGSDRPDLTGVGNSWDPIHLTFSATAPELLAIEYEGHIYGRPDDQASPWSERINLSGEPWWYCCGFTRLVKSPNSSSYYTNNYGNILEIASDFSSVSLRPYLPYDISSMAANTATVELVGISYDGLIFARPPDEATEWSQRYTLPFAGRWDDRWQAITQAPANGDMFAITRRGDLYEISADLATETNRPDVPASNIVDLIATPAGLLVALTEDGRVFSRYDDESSQWTLRYTLPRNLIP